MIHDPNSIIIKKTDEIQCENVNTMDEFYLLPIAHGILLFT